MNHTQMLKILNFNKVKLGLASWQINIKKDYIDLGDTIAEAEWDYWDKTILLTLTKKYKKHNDTKQTNTLIHELIHARIGIAQDQIDRTTKSAKNTIEETLVNDLTKMVEYGVIK